MIPVRLRSLTSADAALLEEATLGNLNWSGERFTVADVRNTAEFCHYTHLVEERGDFGLVAEVDGTAVGVAWALFLPSIDPGFGFVDRGTPEVSLWVRAGSRGSGVGRALLQALVREAGQRGLRQVSLSVESANRAKALYVSEGFVDVPGRESDGAMLCATRDK